MNLGVVLSGGGARGAYEAGVLSYVFSDLVAKRGMRPDLRLVCGTSVGAINGGFLAAVADDPALGISRLVEIWSSIALGDVFDFSVVHATRLYQVVFGGRRAIGLLDARPMARLIHRELPWRRLARNLRDGRLAALVISTTHVGTGRTVIHVDTAPDTVVPPKFPRGMVVRRDRIRVEHVLASAAIPILFPPVLVGGDLYCDGGLRLNTPMTPAIHLGADRLLVVGNARATPDSGAEVASYNASSPRVPGATFLLGKVLNAFLLDHVVSDLEELKKVNDIVRAGERAFGPEFLPRLNESLAERVAHPIRDVRSLAVRPSEDIGRLAAEHLRANPLRLGRELGRGVGRVLVRLLDFGEASDADLASYLLFDGAFARTLVALGRRDAAARHDEIEAFLFDEAARET